MISHDITQFRSEFPNLFIEDTVGVTICEENKTFNHAGISQGVLHRGQSTLFPVVYNYSSVHTKQSTNNWGQERSGSEVSWFFIPGVGCHQYPVYLSNSSCKEGTVQMMRC